MIITLALALAYELVADPLFRMISRGLKDLLTITATEIFHKAAPSTLEFSRETPLDLSRPQRISTVFGPRTPTRLCGVASSTRLLDLLGWVGDRLSLGTSSLHKNIQRIFGLMHCNALARSSDHGHVR
jgi:hypothetical protein